MISKEATIKCSACDQVLGKLRKTIITQQDHEKYAEMVECDNGHKAAILTDIKDVEIKNKN